MTGKNKVPNATDVWGLVLKKEAETRQQEAEKERRREQAAARREKARRRQEKQREIAFEQLGNLVEGLRSLNFFVRSSKIRLSDRSDIAWHCSSPQHSYSAANWIIEFGGIPSIDGRISISDAKAGLPCANLELSCSAVPVVRIVLSVSLQRAQLIYTLERHERADATFVESVHAQSSIGIKWRHDFEPVQLGGTVASGVPEPDWDEKAPDQSWRAVNVSRFNYLLNGYKSTLLRAEFERAISEEFERAKPDQSSTSPEGYTSTYKISTESMVEIAEELRRQVNLYLESEMGELCGQVFSELESVLDEQRRRFDDFKERCLSGYLSIVNHVNSLPPAEVPGRLAHILRYPVINKRHRDFELRPSCFVPKTEEDRARFAKAVGTFDGVDHVELTSSGCLEIYLTGKDKTVRKRIADYCRSSRVKHTFSVSLPKGRSFRPSDKKSQQIYDELVAKAKLARTVDERVDLAGQAGFHGLFGLAQALRDGRLEDI